MTFFPISRAKPGKVDPDQVNSGQANSGQTNPAGLTTLTIGLLAISFAPIFIRLSETELGANGTVFNRLFVFVTVFGLGRWLSNQFSPVSPDPSEPNGSPSLSFSQWGLLVGIGLVSVISLGLWALSLEYTSVAKSMLLNNLTPIFTSLGAWLWLGKRFDNQFLLGLVIALLGAVGLGLEDLQGGVEGGLLGDSFALLSAVFLAAYFLMVEQLRSRFSATTILLWRCGVGAGLLLPWVLLTEDHLFPTSFTAILAVLGLGLVCEGLGQRFVADAMQGLSSSFVSLFLLLEPILSALWAWVIFSEHLNPTTWVGFAVVLTGIYLAQSSPNTAAT
jgi:drug/metabolite transporter (DMT)-like permease